MAADIQITDLINGEVVNNKWQGTGTFDVLIKAVNDNIEMQYNMGRITGSDYAQVYLGAVQSVLQQATQYHLTEKVQEAQIDNLIADNALKTKELEIREAELDRLKDTTEAELEKQWGYEVSRDVDGNLVLGASTSEGKVDKDILAVLKQTDVAERQMVEAELTGAKQRILLDEEKETSDLQQIILATEEELKTAQVTETLDATVRANTQLTDQLATSEKQRVLLDTEEEVKQYEHDVLQLDQHSANLKQENLLDKQAEELDEKIDLLQTQDSELVSNGVVDRDIKERQMVVSEEQLRLSKPPSLLSK
jgi:hypothetical protein